MLLETFWLLIAVILVDAVLCVVFGILWVRAKSTRRFGTPSDPFADDSYAVAERDRRNFQARGLAALIFIGALVLSLCGLWQFGLFDDPAGVSLVWVIPIVVAVVAASILLAAIVGQVLMPTGMRSSQDKMLVSWKVEEAGAPEETSVWQHSEDLDHEQTRYIPPVTYKKADHLNVVWRVALLLVMLLGSFICPYLGGKLPGGLIPVEFLKKLGLEGIWGLVPLFIVMLGLCIIYIASRRDRRGRGQRRPGVDYLWDKIVEEPPVPAEIPDWVRQLAPPEVKQGLGL